MRKEKIKSINVHLVSAPVPGNLSDATRKVETIGYTIVRIVTEGGVEGFGVTYNEVGGEATKSLIVHSMAQKLIGRDPFETEVIWQELFQFLRGVGRKGLMLCALSAVDIAIWDLKGKLIGLPLYKLFGGCKTRIPVYASGGWTSYEDDLLVSDMKRMVADGYNMLKFKVGVEGGANPARDVKRVEKVRNAVGENIGLMLDANNCWDAATAVQFANSVREFNIMFLEEPVPADDIVGLTRYKRCTDIPLATGEHEYTKFGARELVRNEAADIVQMDATRAGGFTEMLKVAAITEAWNLLLAPHAMDNIHIHLVSAASNAPFLERLVMFDEITSRVYKNAPVPKNGIMEIPDLPGLGLELNMDFIREHQK
jgi:L-alanine-DL-glutamate epimerase-like enolase superfamily enzyme